MAGRFHLSFAPGVGFLGDPAGQWGGRGESVRISGPRDGGVRGAGRRPGLGGAGGTGAARARAWDWGPRPRRSLCGERGRGPVRGRPRPG